jgi:hypothetical protein
VVLYRARDLKLKRQVAIKILPGEFAQDCRWDCCQPILLG